MTVQYDAAFSAAGVNTPWDGGGYRFPSLYCLNIAANHYDCYEWSGTKRPWFGDTPDAQHQGKLVGPSSADEGLFGHWAIPWNTVDGAYCWDTTHVYLFNGTDCIYYSLETSGSFPARTPETDAVTNPVPISSVFGCSYTVDKTTTTVFPLAKVDAAFTAIDKSKNKTIWFFGNNQCYNIDYTTNAPEDGFQDNNGKPITRNISDQWSNLPDDLKNGLTWAAPTLNSNGNILDSAHLVTGTTWCPVTPSTQTPRMHTYTTPGDPDPFTVPTDVDKVFVELWGPGGQGGTGGGGSNGGPLEGGDGGAGVYLHDVIPVSTSDVLTVHIGQQGDYTSADLNHSTILIAPGGGGGGGGVGGTNGGAGGAGGGASGGTGGGSDNSGGGGGSTTAGGKAGGNARAGSTTGGGKGGDGGGNSGFTGGEGGSNGGGGGAGGGGAYYWGGGGGGGGGKGDGGNGGGGGGGGVTNYAGGAGGGGAAGPPRLRNSTQIGWGSGATPDNNPPKGAAAGGAGGTGGGGGNGTLGEPGGNGAARISW